jgi:adenosylcobinamide-GDP ribazoletransferase
VRENEDSKAKPIGKAPFALSHTAIAGVFGLLPLFTLLDIRCGLVLIPLLLMRWYLARYFFKWIGGFTCDCLGAAQQVLELVFYLGVLGIANQIT